MAKFGASQEGDQVDAPTLVRALIVTGDRRTAALIGEMLQASWSDGLVVAHAGQLTDATHELLEHAASCVLLDLSEHEDRIAAVEQIRTAAPDVPIVVLAERADEDEAVTVVKAGAQDYLVRSELSPALLRRAVMYAIERKRLEAQLAHRALHDPLTGLPNRALFLDRLGVALDRSRRNNASIAVLFLDVDNFKQINDSLGHAAGDRLLSGLADRLQSMLRPMDTVARFGGDEFTFLFEELTSEREVILIAERIGRAVRLPIHLEEADTTVTVSIGISIVTDPTMRRRDGDPRGRLGDVPRQAARPLALRAVRRDLAAARGRPARARGRAAPGARAVRAARALPAQAVVRGRRAARHAASRRCCAGSTPRAGCSRRASSCSSPRTAG